MERKFWPAFDKNTYMALNSGRFVLALIGLMLSVAGGVGEWLHFPLSSWVAGISLSYGERNNIGGSVLISQGLGFLVLVGGAVIAALLGRMLISRIMLAFALVALFYFPAYLLFVDTGWIVQYIREADQYNGLRSFLVKYFIPNTGVEFPTSYLTGFEFLPDRFLVVLAVLSWGWILAMIGVCMIILNLRSSHEKGMCVGNLSIALSFAIALVLAIFVGFDEIRADYHHSQGDKFLAQGDYSKAIDNYASALAKDSALQHSDLFLLNVSSAFLAQEGKDHPFAQVYVSEEYTRRLLPIQAALHLEYFVAQKPLDSIFASPLLSHSLRKIANIYLKSGGVRYTNGKLVPALSDFDKALAINPNLLTGNFFRAKVLLDLRKYEDCKGIMEKLVDKIDRASMKANFYSTLAECFTGMGNYQHARDAYFSSYKLDNRENYWALKGLSGT